MWIDAGSGFTSVATVLANTTSYKFVGLDLATSYDFHVTIVMESKYVPPAAPPAEDAPKHFACLNGTLFVNGTATVNGTVLVNGTRLNVTVVDDELVVGGPVANASVCPPHEQGQRRRLAPGGAISSGPASSSLTVVTVPFAQTIVYPGLTGVADPGMSGLRTAPPVALLVLTRVIGTLALTGRYPNSATTTYLFKPAAVGTWRGMELSFEQFDVECNYDDVVILEELGDGSLVRCPAPQILRDSTMCQATRYTMLTGRVALLGLCNTACAG